MGFLGQRDPSFPVLRGLLINPSYLCDVIGPDEGKRSVFAACLSQITQFHRRLVYVGVGRYLWESGLDGEFIRSPVKVPDTFWGDMFQDQLVPGRFPGLKPVDPSTFYLPLV